MTEPNLFDNTELTVLGELQRNLARIKSHETDEFDAGWNAAISHILTIIAKLKPTEIEKLKLAFAEGGAIPQSAESWVRKFRQG